MDEYKQPYLILWRGICDAIAAIERQNFGSAVEALKKAQEDAEEMYISSSDGGADVGGAEK